MLALVLKRCKVTGPCFSASFTKGNDLHDSLFASMDDKALLKGGQLLTLLHSEGPKLYGVLAILRAIGLRERICYKRSKSKFFSLRVDSQLRRETKGVPSLRWTSIFGIVKRKAF